jgi:hypothetical protein
MENSLHMYVTTSLNLGRWWRDDVSACFSFPSARRRMLRYVSWPAAVRIVWFTELAGTADMRMYDRIFHAFESDGACTDDSGQSNRLSYHLRHSTPILVHISYRIAVQHYNVQPRIIFHEILLHSARLLPSWKKHNNISSLVSRTLQGSRRSFRRRDALGRHYSDIRFPR